MLSLQWDIVFEVLIYLKSKDNLNLEELTGYLEDKILHLLKIDNVKPEFIKLLVFYIDETILKKLGHSYTEWSLLQVKYFNTNVGGKFFFDIVDSNKDIEIQKLALILLKLGFMGRFFGDNERIGCYINEISIIIFSNGKELHYL